MPILLQEFGLVGIEDTLSHSHGVLGKQGVAALDVDVDIGQGLKPAILIIGILQQLYPQAQTAYLDALGVDVHAEKAVLDDGAFLLEEGLLEVITRAITQICE